MAEELKAMIAELERIVELQAQIAGNTPVVSVVSQRRGHSITIDLSSYDAMLFSTMVFAEMRPDDDGIARVCGRIANIYARLTEEEKAEIEQRPLRIQIGRE